MILSKKIIKKEYNKWFYLKKNNNEILINIKGVSIQKLGIEIKKMTGNNPIIFLFIKVENT